ncbi:MAG: type II toxin-antitoxin system RelE/ParE family toxin [Candidatus Limnocylindria bacterium]
MAHRVVIRRSATRELGALPQPTRGRVVRAIEALASDPRPTGAKLLSEPGRRWRLRVGDYRILYWLDDDRVVVVVVRVRHRSNAYRNL